MQFSIQDVKKRIPDIALEQFEAQLAPERLRLCMEGIRQKRNSSFRLNLLLGERSEVVNQLRKEGIRFRDVPGIEHAFLLDSTEKELQKSTPYKDGKIYLQGLSGMLAPLMLEPKSGERVLDMAAAPGSKTTMLAGLMNNKGSIDAIEPDYIRMERLKFNCNIMGVENTDFHQIVGEKFKKEEAELYDAVLADVPCSGEGRFNLHDKPSYIFWKHNTVPKFARLQYKILKAAIRLTKPGGRILYSTCTMNDQENEGVILQALEEFPELSCTAFKTPINNIEEYEPVSKGALKALRITPSPRFEGFFLCLLNKA
tara:strand:+ start:18013 stop:18951 length:939 start_codon:yes stop_codon:yes gene_type:complete